MPLTKEQREWWKGCDEPQLTAIRDGLWHDVDVIEIALISLRHVAEDAGIADIPFVFDDPFCDGSIAQTPAYRKTKEYEHPIIIAMYSLLGARVWQAYCAVGLSYLVLDRRGVEITEETRIVNPIANITYRGKQHYIVPPNMVRV